MTWLTQLYTLPNPLLVIDALSQTVPAPGNPTEGASSQDAAESFDVVDDAVSRKMRSATDASVLPPAVSLRKGAVASNG